MLRFGAHVSCRLFRAEIALVLHQASVWSELAGDVVTVQGIGALEELEDRRTPVDLAVELAIGELEDADPARLAGYLARILAAAYVITVNPPIVHVHWDARRTGGEAGAGGPRAPWPSG